MLSIKSRACTGFCSIRLLLGFKLQSSFVLCRGCLHTGQRVTCFLPQRIHSKDATARHAAVYASQAGSLGYVPPLLDQTAEPLLQKLQRQMVLAQPQAAGLNPAAFRCADELQQMRFVPPAAFKLSSVRMNVGLLMEIFVI